MAACLDACLACECFGTTVGQYHFDPGALGQSCSLRHCETQACSAAFWLAGKTVSG